MPTEPQVPEEAVGAGWDYVEANAEGPWSRPTFAAALQAAAPSIRNQERQRIREALLGEIEQLDAIHLLADQESIRQGADGNHFGEFEAQGIATTAKNARDRLRTLLDSIEDSKEVAGE